jgi:chitodextrinase
VKRLILSLFLLLVGLAAAHASQPQGALWAASDGQGTISLFWIPKDLVWPAGGWRLEKVIDKKRHMLAEKITPGGNPDAMARLAASEATAIRNFTDDLKSAANPEEDRKRSITIMGLSAAINPDFGRALGLRYEDADPQGGVRTYRLTALNSKGKPLSVLTSAAVDPAVATALPEAPPSFSANPNETSVALSWLNPQPNRLVPVLAFVLEREDATGGKILLTEQPVLITRSDVKDQNGRYVDSAPPKESETTYRIFSIDMFGRRSLPRTLTQFIPDLSALNPPALFAAEAGENQVALSWEANPSPFTSGYVIERSLLRKGPFLPLTPDGLDADQTQWEDKQLQGGTSYFYRVRSMDPRGNLGPPTLVKTAAPKNRQAPPKPENLNAEVGRTRVRLTWDGVKFPVAGYLVERKAKDAERWALLTSTVVPGPHFDDPVGLHTQGEFHYRVTAVAFDNQQSKPSREVKAVLMDTVSPNPPRITDIDGRDGKVSLRFAGSPPEEDIDTFLVVRSVSENDPGLVLGDPVPAKKNCFEDTFVAVGQTYWYRIVAVDQNGNRSDPSWARQVTVGNPAIPAPDRPSLAVEQEPLRHVRISFKTPPEELEVIVQRYEKGNVWRPLTGGIRNATDAVDLNPPQLPTVRYRLIYRAANGALGDPSPDAEATFE